VVILQTKQVADWMINALISSPTMNFQKSHLD